MRRKYTSEQLREIRSEAIALRLRGIRPKEISKRLGTGHSPSTISRWLKKSKEIPTTRETVVSFYEQGWSSEEISARCGITDRHVRSILQEYRGKLIPDHNSTEDNVNRFLDDPEKHKGERFTQSGPFGWLLLKKCLALLDDDPLKGRDPLIKAIELFSVLRETRRKPASHRAATCLLGQAIALDAHIDMITTDPEKALGKLEDALSLVGGCEACEADYFRRLALAYAHLGHLGLADKWILKSLAKYKSLKDEGHDLYGSGLGACYLAKSAIKNLSEGPEAAAVEAREGLRSASPKKAPFLYSLLVLALAVYLKDSRDVLQIREARILLDECMDFFHTDEPTVGRIYTRWLDGALAFIEGNSRDAQILLRHALEDVRKLKLDSEMAAILADIGAVNPSAGRMKSEIEEMLVWDWTAEEPEQVLPKWIGHGIREAVAELYRSAKKSAKCAKRTGREIERAALEALRDAAESASSGKVLPAFVL